MAYPPKISQQPYNWWTNRNGQAIVAIVAHGTVGTDSRAYLSRGGDLPDGSDKKVSIHALIQKPGDPIYRYVPDERGANHAGYGTMPAPWTSINPNLCTLGFELENLQDGKDPYTDTQLLAMGWLINQWRAKWGPLPIFRHEDLDPTRKHDTVNLTIAQIEAWAVKAAQATDPLKVRTLPGPAGTKRYCGIGFYDFYNNHGGTAFFGYAVTDEAHGIGQDGRACTWARWERAVAKYITGEGVHQALLSEAKAQGWL